MTPETRRAVAFIAGQLVSGKKRNIYDYDSGAYGRLSGEVSPQQIRVYDHDTRAHVTGDGQRVYHYGNRAFILLDVTGKIFKGYDYASSSHFMGNVRQNNVTLYDYQASKYFQFLLT